MCWRPTRTRGEEKKNNWNENKFIILLSYASIQLQETVRLDLQQRRTDALSGEKKNEMRNWFEYEQHEKKERKKYE